MVPETSLLVVGRSGERKREQVSTASNDQRRWPLVPARASRESTFRNFVVPTNRIHATRHATKMSAVENMKATMMASSSSIEDSSAGDSLEQEDEENQSPLASNALIIPVNHPGEERKRGPRKKPKKIPRPPNSFIIFRSEHQGKIKREQPSLPNTEISRIIGQMWHKLTADEKKIYEIRAIEAKQEHAVKHPTWRFCPRRRKHRSSSNFDDILTSTSLSKGLLVPSNASGTTMTTTTGTGTNLPISGMVGSDGSTYPRRFEGSTRLRSLPPIPYPTFGSAQVTNFQTSPSLSGTTATITLSPSTSTIRDTDPATTSTYSRYPSPSKPFDLRTTATPATTLRPDAYNLPPPQYPLLYYVYSPLPPSMHYHQHQHPPPAPLAPPSYQHARYVSPNPLELMMSHEKANYGLPVLDEDNMDRGGGGGSLETNRSRRIPNIVVSQQHIMPTPPSVGGGGIYDESMATVAAAAAAAVVDESNKFSLSATPPSQTSLFSDNRGPWSYKMRIPSFGMSPPVPTQETAQEFYLTPSSRVLRTSPATLNFPPEGVPMTGAYPSSNFIMGSQLPHSPMDFLLPPTNRRGN
jgi:hypothetical protein